MRPLDQEPTPPVAGTGAENKLERLILAISSGVDRHSWKVVIGYTILVSALLLTSAFLSIWMERPVDDTAGTIKNYQDVAAESTVTLESFDPDSQVVHASVEVRQPNIILPEMNAVKKLNLPSDTAVNQITFALGKLKVRDEDIDFILNGIRLSPLDLGPSEEGVNVEIWKSEVPQVVKDVELTAEGSPRLYPFDNYLVVGRLDLPLRMSYEQRSVDVLWKNYRVKSRLGGLLIESLSLDEIKERATHLAMYPYGTGDKGKQVDELGAKLAKDAEKKATTVYGLSPENAWIASRFVIEIHRPLLLQILAVLLIVNAIAFSLWIAFKTEPKDYISAAAGYLVAMWAAKSILGGQAPKLPSLLDFVIVFLFFFQTFVIVVRAYVARHQKHPAVGFAGSTRN
jgi:hypothetical protein